MNAVAPPTRPCPVVACTNAAVSGELMCVTCWMALPEYMRRAVVNATGNAGRRPTAHTIAVRNQAQDGALRLAASLRL